MALVGNSRPHTVPVELKDQLLKTNGALVSMKGPPQWTCSQTTYFVGGVCSTNYRFRHPEGGAIVGIYFGGIYDDEFDGNYRRKNVFDQSIDIKAGTPEADGMCAETGALRTVSRLQAALWDSASNARGPSREDCLSFRTGKFKDFPAVIIESQGKTWKALDYRIDTLGDARLIYELYYSAATEKYETHLQIALDIFDSTIWRTDFDPESRLSLIDAVIGTE